MAKVRKSRKRVSKSVTESEPPRITEEDLHEQLKQVFVLNDASATLILRDGA